MSAPTQPQRRRFHWLTMITNVIEVVLIAGSYFADIEDGRMKSFGLVSATISQKP